MKERRSYDAERNLKLVTTPLVCLSDVSKQFDRIRALEHVSLAIPEGRIIGLLGPNGSGKTTMLKILAGLYTEYEGSVSIDGLRPGRKDKGMRRVSAGQQLSAGEDAGQRYCEAL